MRARTAILIGLAVVAGTGLFFVPAFHQDPGYHAFADQRTLRGIPNFWNVVSNAAFLVIALVGLGALRRQEAFIDLWDRGAYIVLLAGTALVAFGSSWYHLRPTNETLFWDRLPMTLVFMSLLASTIVERISRRAGPILLPLLLIGAGSVVYWRVTEDLRPYMFVQFYPLLAIPPMLFLFPPRYTRSAGLWWMAALYALSKVLEMCDRQIGDVLPVGGHPWKHVTAAAALGCYVTAVMRRRPVQRCAEFSPAHPAQSATSLLRPASSIPRPTQTAARQFGLVLREPPTAPVRPFRADTRTGDPRSESPYGSSGSRQ